VALRALALLCALRKLPAVRIGLVALRALFERQWLFEVSSNVAGDTAHRRMLPEQWILGLRMIELKSRRQFLPARRRMAMLAGFLELPVMRIQVARRACPELHVFKPRWPARHIRLVAFFASHLDVESRQRISRLRVVKLLRCFPVARVVAARAILSKLPLVVILVAADAFLRQPQVTLVQVLVLNQASFRRRDVLRCVALLALNLCVLSIKRISAQLVIELLEGYVPVNQIEIGPIMLQVAAHAILAVGILHLQVRVVPVLLRKRLGDLLVAIQALKCRSLRPKLMAARALRCARQGLVRLRERTGRNLRFGGKAGRHEENQKRKSQSQPQQFRSPRGKTLRQQSLRVQGSLRQRGFRLSGGSVF